MSSLPNTIEELRQLWAANRSYIHDLVQNGYDIDKIITESGATLLIVVCNYHTAFVENDIEILLALGANPNIITKSGNTALTALKFRSYGDSDKYANYIRDVRLLISAGADINRCGSIYTTLGVNISQRIPISYLREFMDLGADPNGRDRERKVPLMAIMTSRMKSQEVEYATVLVEYGADIDVRDDKDVTTLMYACASNAPELVQYLLSLGATITSRDFDRVKRALNGRHADCITLIEIAQSMRKLSTVDVRWSVGPHIASGVPTDTALTIAYPQCSVCLDAQVDTILHPCYHACLCFACAQRLNTCPVCRYTVTIRHKVYFC